MSSLDGDMCVGRTLVSCNNKSSLKIDLVTNRRNSRKSKSDITIPTSPGLKHIINNPQTFITSNSAFNYNNSLSMDNNTISGTVINGVISSDNFNELNSNTSISHDNSTAMDIS